MIDDQFPSTRMSLLQQAASETTEQKLVALGCMYERYRTGLAAVLERRFGLHPHDAENLLHEFLVTKLLDGQVVAKYLEVISQKGSSHRRFRNYLSRSIHNFAIDWYRRQHSAQDLERCGQIAAEAESDFDQLLNAAWLEEMLTEALRMTREHYLAKGATLHWELFLKRWIEPAITQRAPQSLDALAETYELESGKQVGNIITNAFRTLRKHWRQLLQDDLATNDDQEIAEAIDEARDSLPMSQYLDGRRLLVGAISTGDTQQRREALKPDQLALLLSVVTAEFDDLTPIEQELLFQSLLDTPISELFTPDQWRSAAAPEPIDVPQGSLAELLGAEHLPPGTARTLNTLLQEAIRQQSSNLPAHVAGIFRFLLLVEARKRQVEDVTSLTDRQLREAVQRVANTPWIDAETRNAMILFSQGNSGSTG